MLSTKNLKMKPGRTKKFAPKFIGPFTVVEVLAKGNAYRLNLPHQYRNLHPTFHISLLKGYSPDPSLKPRPTPFNIDVTHEADSIDRITTRSTPDGNIQFLVHFKNTDSIEETWIDTEAFPRPDLIPAYLNSLFENE